MRLIEKFLAPGIIMLLISAGAGPAMAAADLITTATKTFSPGFKGELEKVVASHDGIMGVYVHNLKTDETIDVNADEPFPTASTIKLGVMCAAMDLLEKGTGPYDSYYDTQVFDVSKKVGGSGFIQNYRDGTKIELKELLHFMITASDNTATNMICEWIGLDTVNDWLSSHGFKQTRIFSTIGGSSVYDQKGREEWGLGRTTPREIGTLLEMICTGKAGTTSSTDEMLRLLGNQYFDGNIAAEAPATIYVGSKSGSVNHSRSDTAIIAAPTGTYILTVYTKHNADTSWNNKNKAEAGIRKVARLVWKHYNPKSKWTRPAGCENF